MKAIYVQRGEAIDYTNSGEVKIDAGTIVSLGTRVGIAGTDIPVGAVGSLHTIGVFEADKAAVSIALGDAVYFDEDNSKITNVGGVPCGWAIAAADSDATKVRFSLGAEGGAAALVTSGALNSVAVKQGDDVYDIGVSAQGAVTATKRS